MSSSSPLEDQTITIHPPDEEHIGGIVSLHQMVLGETLNSQLGIRHLEHLYHVMLQSPDCFIGVAMKESHLVGFVSGALDLDAVKPLLFKTMSFNGWRNIAKSFIQHPALLLEFWNGNQVGKPIFMQGKRINSILTTIGVNPNFQGLGIGKKLVHALENYFRAQGVEAYRLDTLETNHQARTFYTSLGFVQSEIRADSIIFLKELN